MKIKSIPRPEYPRPDFERTEWMNLNGEWGFELDDANTGEKEGWYIDRVFSKKIIVPFSYQCEFSGINDKSMHENLWYRKEFSLPESMAGKRIMLNFGAVDYICKVWLNGSYIGFHKGGYTPFKMDVTEFINQDKNTLVIKVEDRYECVQPRGKQYWKAEPDRCWYTATSGIWQTVWLEVVGDNFIDKVRMTPDIDLRNVVIEVYLDKYQPELEVLIKVMYQGSLVNQIRTNIYRRILKVTLDINEEII